jgi:rod shape-determining protein MreD
MAADEVARHETGSWRYLAMALLLALWLQSLPWSGIGLLLRPDFLLLLVLYGSLHHPHRVGMGWAFALGMLSDFQDGVVFGQHAMAYAAGSYAMHFLRLRLLQFDPLRQAIQLLPVFLMVQLSVLLIGWLAVAPFVALLAIALLARAYYLQIMQHEHYIQRAESNRISLVPSAPHRGLILDRNDRILAENYSAYTLELMRARIDDLEATLAELGTLIEITPGQLRRFRRLLAESHEFETVPLKSKLTDEEAAILAAHRYRLPGVEVKARLFRNYPAGDGMAHVVGFHRPHQ